LGHDHGAKAKVLEDITEAHVGVDRLTAEDPDIPVQAGHP
jgi:hypothetical protein